MEVDIHLLEVVTNDSEVEYGTEKDPNKCSNKMHGTRTW